MASPRTRASPLATGATRSPVPRVAGASPPATGGTPLGDEAIWRRLREAGFDEESVKRRDKAALIAYISKLEAEIYDYQHHMGLLILERKEWTSKYEQVKTSAESAEVVYKREKAAQLSALAEARQREESLKKALGIEKECVANIEKALHDMRAESAETKLAYENKLAEARQLMEAAQQKFDEAERKLLASESLHAEASRSRNTALRNLQDVEAREDELRRDRISFKSECDAKEQEINRERQSLYDRQKILNEEQERLIAAQTLLNQREEYIFERSKELSCFEKELEEARRNLEEKHRALKEENSNLDLKIAGLANREESVIKRESLLDKRERELLILQEKIACKEHDEIQRLMDEHQSALQRKRSEFEAELEQRRMMLDDEMEAKQMAYEIREADLNDRENAIREREHAIKLESSALAEKEEDVVKKLKLLDEREQKLHFTQKAAEIEMQNMQNERAQILKMKRNVENSKSSLEDEKKEIQCAQEKLELTVAERNELLVLERKLQEEIDNLRTQKMELTAEADKLKAEKEKFEIEWELMDEKREELRKEAERVAEERKAVDQYLKNEHDSIKLEKENFRNQFKSDVESLAREREEFLSKMEREHLDWFSKIQQEREDFVRDIMIQKKELENCMDKRREEIETYLKEKEEAFEKEKARELQHIGSQKELIAKELEHVASEMQKLNDERMEIALDRERREKECSEIKSSIEALNIQREKLQKQRELLHSDREEIYEEIQRLKKLEHLDIESENRALSETPNTWRLSWKTNTNADAAPDIDDPIEQKITANGGSNLKLLSEKTSDASPRTSTTLSWVRKCAEVIFKLSPEKNIEYVEYKNSAKSAGVSEGNGYSSPKAGSHRNKNSGDGKRISLSKWNDLQIPSVASEVMESKGHERRGRRETQSVRSDSPYVERNQGLCNAEIEGNREKELIEDSEKSRNADGALPLGRKRLHNTLSHEHADMQLEPSRKHQRKTRQNGSADVEGVTSDCLHAVQMPNSDDCDPSSLNPTAGCEELPVGCKDQEYENPEVSISKTPEVSKDTSTIVRPHILENGNSHGSENSSLLGDGILLYGSNFHKMLKKQENVGDQEIFEAEEPSKEITTPTMEQTADDGGKIKEQDGCNQDGDDEVEDEDDDRLSMKEKLWKFIIT
ncbi:nuclear matrix constituent protein 1b isoform X1 [Elaeis guineensis]|uniref:Protein CROWDED NUCLEI 4 isoform X1 n=1 Tax=Elaeis guineensis var. tenera TaxID=51953 RepID=A0A6J0PSN2_ELAGV|nr:protein CROWDED NUCLEI 4 isoform X1 [Elaeis guineensis]XP_019711276.1 protein CROWDED NUCLEI 4 isoform X1 [Elaeis guineensis]